MRTALELAEAILKSSLKDAAKVGVAEALSTAVPAMSAAAAAAAGSAAEFLAGSVLKIIIHALAGTSDKMDLFLGSHLKAGVLEMRRALEVQMVSVGDEVLRHQLAQNAHHLLALAMEHKPEHALLVLNLRALMAFEMGALGFATSFCEQVRHAAIIEQERLSSQLQGLERTLAERGVPTGTGRVGGRTQLRKAIGDVEQRIAELRSIAGFVGEIEARSSARRTLSASNQKEQ